MICLFILNLLVLSVWWLPFGPFQCHRMQILTLLHNFAQRTLKTDWSNDHCPKASRSGYVVNHCKLRWCVFHIRWALERFLSPTYILFSSYGRFFLRFNILVNQRNKGKQIRTECNHYQLFLSIWASYKKLSTRFYMSIIRTGKRRSYLKRSFARIYTYI